MYDKPRFLSAGDSALIIELGNEISEECNARVVSLSEEIRDMTGVVEILPTYRSLLVYYDPSLIEFDEIKETSKEKWKTLKTLEIKGKVFEVPVCYDDDFGPDLSFVAQHSNMSEEEVIRIHCSGNYRVFMLGFLPGFPYLGGMDERIAAPRLEKPRTKIPAGSVGIAGKQTGIYPLDSPGGWRIIGRTPVKMYDPEAKDPVPIRAGDTIRFVRISKREYEEQAK